jgi:transglutaminase-like putative cysteine protease
VGFLVDLNRRIHASCRGIVRENGDPRDPEVTLEARSGACRDLAVLFMAACRAAGIAPALSPDTTSTSGRSTARSDHPVWPA